MITKELIEKRINNFWGYWNLKSDIWFIWMEEWFNGDLIDLEKRFKKTYEKDVVDIQDDMTEVIDHIKWFLPKSNIQKTRGKLILILLRLKWEKIENYEIKKFQRFNFARNNSNHCNLVFMPLPCRSVNTKDWFYDRFWIEYLKKRSEYISKVMPLRIRYFSDLLKNHKPKIVIFYSFSYLNKWQEIIWSDFDKVNKYLYTKKIKNVNFFVIPHPCAHGITNQRWLEISNSINIGISN